MQLEIACISDMIVPVKLLTLDLMPFMVFAAKVNVQTITRHQENKEIKVILFSIKGT